MSTELLDRRVSEYAAPSQDAVADRPASSGRLWTIFVFLWKWSVGAMLCLNPLGSILVLGWTHRLVQRSVLKRWWMRSGLREDGNSWIEFAQGGDATREHAHWPNWVLEQNAGRSLREAWRRRGWFARIGSAVRCAAHSLWRNLALGAQAIFNTWVVTMPIGCMWLFSWYDGWNNSFHKGYEQWWVGPFSGWAGVFLFMVVMLYVPMAQTRQAATGNWRSFYQFRLVTDLIRQRWVACLGLAMLYSLIWLPVAILKSAPGFFTQMMPHSAGWSAAEATQFLYQYFFWCNVAFFPAFILLRVVGGRIYAGALLRAVANGSVSSEDLAEVEREPLERLGLIQHRPRPARNIVVRAIGWSTARLLRFAGTGLTLLVWFDFVALIYISEFFRYTGPLGWLNQPLIQLPWFFYGPNVFG